MVNKIEFKGLDQFISSGEDGRVIIWNWVKGKPHRTQTGLSNILLGEKLYDYIQNPFGVKCFDLWTHNAVRLIYGMSDGHIRAWDLDYKTMLNSINSPLLVEKQLRPKNGEPRTPAE